MNIHNANRKDLKKLAEMRWNFRLEFDKDPFKISKAKFVEHCQIFLKKGLKSENWFYWILEENKKIGSHLFIKVIHKIPKPNNLDSKFGYIINTYTSPEYRNKSLGSKLLEEAIKWAKSESLELLIVWPSKRSISFYEQIGFTSENEILEKNLF